MNDKIFDMILLLIPVIGAVITSFVVPYFKAKISTAQTDEIMKWVPKAVEAAEILFGMPQSGDEKREFVINFIDRMFNAKKEIITKEQIRILLESACKQISTATSSVKSTATDMTYTKDDVQEEKPGQDKLNQKVTILENKPANEAKKKIDGIADKLLWLFVGGVAVGLLSAVLPNIPW